MRIGLLGGTFDPIHMGHLLIGEEARVQLDLDEVVFIPAGLPWMKEGTGTSPAHHRLNMVRLAIGANPFFRASSLEVDRPGPTYTLDTLQELQGDTADADQVYLILGIDSVNEVHRWKEPARILELCTLVAVPRVGAHDMDLGSLSAIHPSASEKVVVLEGPWVDVSGTEIRRRVASGLSVRYQVPEEVERYVYRYGLYGDNEARQ